MKKKIAAVLMIIMLATPVLTHAGEAAKTDVSSVPKSGKTTEEGGSRQGIKAQQGPVTQEEFFTVKMPLPNGVEKELKDEDTFYVLYTGESTDVMVALDKRNGFRHEGKLPKGVYTLYQVFSPPDFQYRPEAPAAFQIGDGGIEINIYVKEKSGKYINKDLIGKEPPENLTGFGKVDEPPENDDFAEYQPDDVEIKITEQTPEENASQTEPGINPFIIVACTLGAVLLCTIVILCVLPAWKNRKIKADAEESQKTSHVGKHRGEDPNC